MKHYRLLALLLISQFAYGQNYHCLQPGVKRYFVNANGYLRGMRIDSVRTYADSTVYFPFHTPRGTIGGSGIYQLDSMGGSWLGKKVVGLADGTFLFDDIWNDTVVIKTRAHVGDSWVFFNDSSTRYYTAKMIAIDTMTVASVVDSVKTILITALDTGGIMTSDPVDSFQILLSKNHGFVQVFDLYTFPYHRRDTAYADNIDFYLASTIQYAPALMFGSQPTKQNAVFQLHSFSSPSYVDLYQWHVGDVYEYSRCVGSDGPEISGVICSPAHQYEMDTVVSTVVASGSTQYSLRGWKATIMADRSDVIPYYSFAYYSRSASGETFASDSTKVVDTVLMPEEYKQSNIFYVVDGDTSFCYTGTLYITAKTLLNGNRYVAPFEYDPPAMRYKAPFGLLSSFSATAGTSGFEIEAQKLIYYNRSGTECGSVSMPPLDVSDVGQGHRTPSLSPNPAGGIVTIISPLKIAKVVVTNLVGQQVLARQCNSEEVLLNVEAWLPGVYFVRINDSETLKFVKQ